MTHHDAHLAFVQRRMIAQSIDCAIMTALATWVLFVAPPLCVPLAIVFLAKDTLPGLSPGKLWLGLGVVDPDTNRRCSLVGSVVRNALIVPPLGMIEALVMGFSDDGLRLADHITHTVVRTREEIATARSRLLESGGPAPYAGLPPAVAIQQKLEGRKSLSRQLLGVSDNADEDDIEQAFWDFAERYSDDATRNLPPEEMLARCRELGQRFGLSAPLDQHPTDDEMRTFIQAHVVAVNRARDDLLRHEKAPLQAPPALDSDPVSV